MLRSATLYATMATMALGCVPTLHPIYREQDVYLDPDFVGSWQTEDARVVWRIQTTGQKVYRLLHINLQDGRSGVFEARLAKIGPYRVLDIVPDQDQLYCGADFLKGHLVPVHSFYLVDELGDRLRLRGLNPNWLKKLIETDPQTVQFEKLDGTVLLTASTEELQQFLQTYGGREDAFNVKLTFLRMPTAK